MVLRDDSKSGRFAALELRKRFIREPVETPGGHVVFELTIPRLPVPLNAFDHFDLCHDT